MTLKKTTAQVVKMSVTVNNNSIIQDYVHPNDHVSATHEMNHRLKPFSNNNNDNNNNNNNNNNKNS